MKPIFLILISVCTASIYALGQPKSILKTIRPVWGQLLKTPNQHGGSHQVLSCLACSETKGNPRIPSIQALFPEQSLSRITLTNPKWDKLQAWEIPGVDTAGILLDIPFEVSIEEIDRKPTTLISIALIRKNLRNGEWEKHISADLVATSKPMDAAKRLAVTQSTVFGQGHWLKIGVAKSGVYSLSGAELSAAGLPFISTNPTEIKVFGTGGKMLSEARNAFRFDDIPEMAVEVTGAADGSFDATDQVLFYAEDPHNWNYNQTNQAFELQPNIYSDTSWYFITSSPGNGKRISTASPEPEGNLNLTYYEERNALWEDKVNVISTGREWYGPVLDFTTTKTYSLPVRGLIWDSEQKFRIGVMARSQTPYPFKISVNGTELQNGIIPAQTNFDIPHGVYGCTATGYFKQQFNPSGDPNSEKITISYDKTGNQSSIGYLNYVEHNYFRQLRWRNEGFGFRNYAQKSKLVKFSIADVPPDFAVWDITDFQNPLERNLQSGSFSIYLDSLREFYGFSYSTILKPVSLRKMANQNLRSLPTPDLLIVAHPNFMAEANLLAQFRRLHDHLDVAVVTPQEIYNEFSSGSQDITAIRNLAMHLYYKSDTAKLKYILLFGDCSFDYRNRTSHNTNFVPTYQGLSHLDPVYGSYASDDYFGILNRTKGGWAYYDLIDVGVGRLPVKTSDEARQMVDKLVSYATDPPTLGKWRNTFTFIADDGDRCTHSDQADAHAANVSASYPPAVIRKIYLGAYEQVANAGGFTSPGTYNDLLNTINEGSLIINYTGHGGETGWADENVFNSDEINQLTNKQRLSFFFTATCDFGRHDLPSQVSGAESLILNPNGGAIGVMTAGRPVNSGSNDQINQAFYQCLFERTADGKPLRLGEILRRTKNKDGSKSYNRGFTLLGDPSATLAFPKQETVITSFLGDSVIQGLKMFGFEGEVLISGKLNSQFTGSLQATVFDRPGILSVNDNEVGIDQHCRSDYKYQKNVLYNGSVAVKNGKFKVQFFVSKDISYKIGLGKISLYAMSNDGQDASGARLNIAVGGANPYPIHDDRGPDISLYMNDNSFLDRGLVGENSTLIAYLEDSSGINVSGLGLGHDLTAMLDDQQVFEVNNYFINELDSYKKGSLAFPLRGLSPGNHSIVMKAWDNFNNSSSKEIKFVVGINEINNLIVKEVNLFPNPFSDALYISLENAYAGQSVHISMDIKDIVGRSVAGKEWDYTNSTARPGAVKELAWDGKKIDGTRLPAGSYFCTVGLKSASDGAEFKINKKLILLH